MRKTSVFVALLSVAALLAPGFAEASYSYSTGRNWRHSSERPTHRTLELDARRYRAQIATHRRQYNRQQDRIESARDTHRDEWRRAEAPTFNVDQQGFVPYHTIRFRRSVRHFHWNTLFQETPDADVGQGPGEQEEGADESGR